jgi:pentachlorophenol monooxygenase/3-(3-hydroxy-phenyl)propionate hydroxylase
MALVAVLGNGPVGQTAALMLARWGLPVVLLDRRAHRDPAGSKSIVQQRDVLDAWAAVGAGRRIADEGITWTTARTFYRDAELFSVTFPGLGQGSAFPPFVNISQSRTEQILDECIAAQPLISVRWDHCVTGLDAGPGGVTVTCATAAGPAVLRADYAVACAGAHGEQVRQMLGVGFAGQTFGDLFLICDIRADLPGWAAERRFYFDPPWNPGRQVLIHPCPDSTYRVDWQVPDGFDETAAGRHARIREIIGDRPYEVLWSSVYRFASRVADRMRAGRVLLAGDLAHQLSPFGARGLNSGVQDAENAAWKIAFVLRGWATDALLDSYHAERHAAARENLEVTSATMRFLVPGTDAERRHRLATLEAAMTDSAARAAVDSGRLAEPFWYTASPLTTPDPARPFAGRPARGAVPAPGPGILVPDLPIAAERNGPTTLRALARAGFVLLCAPGADLAAARGAAEAVVAPARVLDAAALPDSGAGLAAAGLAAPGEVWVIRPDAHAAAVLHHPGQAEITAALRRALGLLPGEGGPPEPPRGPRPRSSVTGPWHHWPGGATPLDPPGGPRPRSSVTGPWP